MKKIKKNLLPDIVFGKDEMNLIEFPFTLLSKQNKNRQKTIEISENFVDEKGKQKKREWIVTGSDKFGLPLAQDNDVWIGLLQIGKEQGFKSPFIKFSRYNLLKIMGCSPQGRNYCRIEEALDRLKGTNIKAKNAFYDNINKGYITLSFGLIESYRLFNPTEKQKIDENLQQLSFVRINEAIFNSIKSGYIKNINTKTYFLLKKYITKRLYRYLDKKRYNNKKQFEIELFRLVEKHLGMTKYKYSSEIKRKLKPAHEELIKIGFLKSVTYLSTADGSSIKVVYVFNDKEKHLNESNNTLQADTKICPSSQDIKKEILIILIEIGISEKIAKKLVEEYPINYLKKQIEALPYRKANNPAALLIRSIKENWTSPVDLKNEIKYKKQAKNIKTKDKEDNNYNIERQQKIKDYLMGLSVEEQAELKKEAIDQAKKDGGDIIKKFGVNEGMLNAYILILAEKKLFIKEGKN